MAIATAHIRHVFREINDGNGEVTVLALQQWHKAEGWEHEDIVAKGGYWEDVPIIYGAENDQNPE